MYVLIKHLLELILHSCIHHVVITYEFVYVYVCQCI
jgi:hypothetical protein